MNCVSSELDVSQVSIPEGWQPVAGGRGAQRRIPREEAQNRTPAAPNRVPVSRGIMAAAVLRLLAGLLFGAAGVFTPPYRGCRRFAPQPPATGLEPYGFLFRRQICRGFADLKLSLHFK